MKNLINKLSQWLCPPGEGVFTVHTAKEKRNNLQHALYETLDPQELRSKWIEELSKRDRPLLLGIPSDCGGGILRGANWGPLYLREQLLRDNHYFSFRDLGDVRVIPHLLHDKYLNDETLEKCRQSLYQTPEKDWPVSPLSITENACQEIYHHHPQSIIVGLGGDHSVSYPLVKTWIKKNKSLNKKCAVLHFDAHTDLLETRLGIDLCFGTWAHHIIPLLESPSHLVQVGIRSSGKAKQHWENTLGVKQHWAAEVLKRGAESIAKEIEACWKKDKIEDFYISFDIDALDIQYAAATGTAEADGIHPHHALIIAQHLAQLFSLTGLDLVEVAPRVSPEQSELRGNEPEKTLLWSSALISRLSTLFSHAP